ncbi:hypothetical protein WJX77_008540 [Trebouxia sp. C0004]
MTTSGSTSQVQPHKAAQGLQWLSFYYALACYNVICKPVTEYSRWAAQSKPIYNSIYIYQEQNLQQYLFVQCPMMPFAASKAEVFCFILVLEPFSGFTSQAGAAGVARWTKKVNVFSQDLLIIPINHHNLHWCLTTVDMRSRFISYYDSMHGSGLSGHAEYRVLPTLAKWLSEERIENRQLSQTTDWQQVTVKELPEQQMVAAVAYSHAYGSRPSEGLQASEY